EHTGLGDGAECTGILGKEDIGRAVVALFENRRGKFGSAGVLDLNIGAGQFGEALDNRIHQGFVAAGVDDQFLTIKRRFVCGCLSRGWFSFGSGCWIVFRLFGRGFFFFFFFFFGLFRFVSCSWFGRCLGWGGIGSRRGGWGRIVVIIAAGGQQRHGSGNGQPTGKAPQDCSPAD